MLLSWDAAARWYDRQLWLERSAIAIAIGLAEVGSAARVLDVGTGTGAVLRELATRGCRPEWVLGIDRSQGMLAAIPALPSGWAVERADIARIPLPDACVDVVFCSFVLHVVSERKRVAGLTELARVLAPGGRIVVVIPALPCGVARRTVYTALVRALGVVAKPLAASLRGVDLSEAIAAAGLDISAAARARWGYPAICLLLVTNSASGKELNAGDRAQLERPPVLQSPGSMSSNGKE